MKVIFAKIIALFMAFLMTVSGLQMSVVGFTDGEPIVPEEREYKFDRDRLLIGGYYAHYDELDYCSGAGVEFIIAGGVDKAYLDKAQSLGVGIIASNLNVPYAYADFYDGTKDAYVNYDPANYFDHPALWGDNVIDEPKADAYDNLGAAVNAYNEKLTAKYGVLPFVNLFPAYASAEEQLTEPIRLTPLQKMLGLLNDNGLDWMDAYKAYTSDYINKIDTDYICVDIYPYRAELTASGRTKKTTDGTWLRNLDVLAEACRATGRDLWVIPQAAGLTENGTKGGDMRWTDEVSDISQQAYASLAFGAKAIIHGLFGKAGWWDMDSHMIGSNGLPTATYYAAAEVDAYLKAFAEEYGKYEYTSTYLMKPTACAGFGAGALNCEIPEEEGNIASLSALCIGTFTGADGAKAYIVTNMEELDKEKTAPFTFTVANGATATVYRKGEISTYTDDFRIALEPGEGVFITADKVEQPTILC